MSGLGLDRTNVVNVSVYIHDSSPQSIILSQKQLSTIFERAMSTSDDTQDWERYKNVIYNLFLVKRKTLEGPDGVMKIMESRVGFKKTLVGLR